MIASGPSLAVSARAALVATLVVAVSCAAPEEASERRPGEGGGTFDADSVAAIDAALGEFDVQGSPGAAVMVTDSGEVVFEKGYGYTDVSGSEALGRATPFRLGSVTKQFTTMAIMILAERGALGYDDPAMETLPEIGRFGPEITIRHLMTHTSGLPDYYEVLDDRLEAPSVDEDPLFTTVDAVATYLDWGELEAVPGEQYEYSNPAYELLALIVERASGQTYAQFLSENIFTPAGMTTAVVRDRPDVKIPGRAIGYYAKDGEWMEDDDHVLNWMVGAGGVYASLDDMRMWDQALANNAIVSAKTLAEAYSPMTLNDGSTSWYGFGWRISEDRQTVGHGGSWVGFRTKFVRSLSTGVSLIILANASIDDEKTEAVAQAVPEVRDLGGV